MNGGPSGFHNAPATRAFVIATGLLTAACKLRGRSLALGLSYQDITTNLRPWKLITSVFAFSSMPELLFGLCLLYYFRIFERQKGSHKYSIFIIFSLIMTSVFEYLALTLLKDSTSIRLASGPYGFIFTLFVSFYFEIPVSSRFRVLGLHISDKSFIYFAGLQLLLLFWKRSLIPSACGVLTGLLYHLNLFGIRRRQFPRIVTSFFTWLSRSSGDSSRSSSSSRNAVRHAGRQIERTYPTAARVAVPEPPESSIAILVSMGFDTNSARQALMRARNDINAATNILLESQSS